MAENIETFEDYLKSLCGDGETFICKLCGHELPIEYKHEEAPEYCFMDFVSEKDRAFMEKVVAEVSSRK